MARHRKCKHNRFQAFQTLCLSDLLYFRPDPHILSVRRNFYGVHCSALYIFYKQYFLNKINISIIIKRKGKIKNMYTSIIFSYNSFFITR